MAPGNRQDWLRPPSVFSFEVDGKHDIEALNSVDFLTIAFRPVNSTPFQLSAEGVHGSAISLWKTSSKHGFISTPKYAADKLTIRIVNNGKLVRRNQNEDHVGQPGRAMFVGFEEMVNEEASSDFEAITGTIDRAALAACHLALEGEGSKHFPQLQPIVEVVSAPMRAFAHNFQTVYGRLSAGLDDGDLIAPLLEELLIYQLLSAWPVLTGRDAVTEQRLSWQVRRALEYIDANLQRRLTLAEVASVVHVGVRSLQLSFRKELGTTPIQWIVERRLARVHGDLLSSSEEHNSVATIARRWGFVHLGDFSRRYRVAFGCSPLETKKNRPS
ncbi:helix-turn-helix transcriptional regulator [Agrobacterium arsenijevicii]|uniref:helix-turn-helix transcriptional regulator n=1 Tax=Agrobacterium arsenijevicii TaxID=1585697 RepID=UPI0006964409